MSQLLLQLSEFIQQMIFSIGYPGIAFIMFLENIIPPIPSEMVMPFAGFLVDDGQFTFWGVWVAGTTGSVVGAVVLYYIGQWLGEPVIRTVLDRYGRWLTLSQRELDRALHVFDRYGEAIVFVGRLIPVVRSLISIPAGMNRMPLSRFLIFTTAGSAIWTGLLAYTGVVLGANWEQILHVIDQYQTVVLVVGAALVVGFVVYRLTRPAHVVETGDEVASD